MRTVRIVASVVVLLGLGLLPAAAAGSVDSAQAGGRPAPSVGGPPLDPALAREVTTDEAFATDAAVYAKSFGVTQGEAVARLHAQLEGSKLIDDLRGRAGTDYADWGVEHAPDFKVYISTTRPERLTASAPGTVGGYKFEVRSAPASRAELAALAERIYRKAPAERYGYDYALVPETGSIEFDTATAEGAAALEGAVSELGGGRTPDRTNRFAMPGGLRVEIAATGRVASAASALGGGRGLSSCTSGFPIFYYYNGNPYHPSMSTAGHCGNQSFGGCALPTFYTSSSPNYDRKATGSGPCNTMPGTFYTGSENRRPTGWAGMGKDSFHCKYGKTTFNDCGIVISTNVDPSYIPGVGAVFVKVVNAPGDTSDLAEGGDSGGPWFSGTVATGITSGDYDSTTSAIVSQGPYVFNASGNFALRATDYPL